MEEGRTTQAHGTRDEARLLHGVTSRSSASADFQGKTYYFCSIRCRTKFEEHPGWYVPVQEETEDWSETSDHSLAAELGYGALGTD